MFSGAGPRASGEPQVAEGPPGQRRPHREAEGGDRLAEQSESGPRSRLPRFSTFPFVFSRVGGTKGGACKSSADNFSQVVPNIVVCFPAA